MDWKEFKNRKTDGFVEALSAKIQANEAYMDSVSGVSTAKLVIPQPSGQVVAADHYRDQQRAQQLLPQIMGEMDRLRHRLNTEPKEDVHNYTDQDYRSSLNGMRYVVAARSTTRLPRTLARHYREKMGYAERDATYDRRLGGRGPGQAEMTIFEAPNLEDYQREVQSFEQIEHEAGHLKGYVQGIERPDATPRRASPFEAFLKGKL